MTVRLTEGNILLAGDCPVEDAETLQGLLIAHPAALVDIGGVGRIHTAVIQLLLAARPVLRGTPPSSFVATWVLPHVLDARGESTSTLIDPNGAPSTRNNHAE